MTPTWIGVAYVDTPDRIARLDRDARGYPNPNTVRYRSDGTPDFRAIDPEKWMRAVHLRCCGICGDLLGVRVAFVGGPMFVGNRLSPICQSRSTKLSEHWAPFEASQRARAATMN